MVLTCALTSAREVQVTVRDAPFSGLSSSGPVPVYSSPSLPSLPPSHLCPGGRGQQNSVGPVSEQRAPKAKELCAIRRRQGHSRESRDSRESHESHFFAFMAPMPQHQLRAPRLPAWPPACCRQPPILILLHTSTTYVICFMTNIFCTAFA